MPNKDRTLDLSEEDPRRLDWDRNHALIMDAYFRLFVEMKRPPTQSEIAQACNLSRKTITSHASKITLDEVMPGVKLHTQRVLYGLTKRAEQGYRPEVELWLQLVHGWVPKSKHELTGKDGQPLFQNSTDPHKEIADALAADGIDLRKAMKLADILAKEGIDPAKD